MSQLLVEKSLFFVVTSDKFFRTINNTNHLQIQQFAKWILDVGDGKLSEPNDGYALIEIPEQFLITNYDNPIHDIVKSTYPNLVDEYMNEEFLQCRAILASIIDTVDEINDYVLSLIPCRPFNHIVIMSTLIHFVSNEGDEREYLSSNSIDRLESNDIEALQGLTTEFLNSLRTSGLPNHKIKLKVGTPIMLLRNLDQTECLCNGTRMIVNRLATHVLEAKVMTEKNVGKIFYIPRMRQPLASIGLYLPRPVFDHGQLYVAFSRVQSMEGLKILIHDKEGKTMNTTINVVSKKFSKTYQHVTL
ncbi:hypothetical protein Lal_00018734 [Lupinus albus]|nr:hypothetical protein Lal_00018734 [Lupinus albus]